MTENQTLRRLIDLKTKLTAADTLADGVRDKALRDYSSEEPYENARALSVAILKALAIVDDMLADAGAANV